VSGRNLQIAPRQTAKSLPVAAARAARWQRAFPLVIALFLTLLFTKVPMGASDSPSSAVGEFSAEAQVLRVRSSSQADSSRVVIDLCGDVRYKVGHLSNPERLYLDLWRTEISPQLTSRRLALKDALVDQIRIRTDQSSVTRIVIDLRTTVRYRVSKLDDPERVLVELSRPPDGTGLVKSTPVRTTVRGAPRPMLASARPNSLSALSQGASSSSSNAGGSRAVSPSGPHIYGDAEKSGLDYAGTSYPRNILLLGLSAGSSYDDNIFGNNKRPVGDVDFLFGPSLSLRREGRHLNLALSYQPHFRIYRRASEPNAVDQVFGFDAAYQASPRLSFRARASAFYTIGIFQPSQNEPFLPGLGSPSSLNNTLFTPTARQLTWSLRIDSSYQASAHDSVGLFVGQSTLDFRQQVSNAGILQNMEEKQAGLLYQHRISRHASLGGNYLFEDIRFGSDSRTLVHSAFFSYAQQVSPSLTISVFGGPQYSRLHDVVSFPLGPFTLHIPIFRAEWSWAIGSTLTERLDKTVFQLNAQHQVSNGGGLVSAVVSTAVGASVRRRLPARWDAIWSAAYAQNSGLEPGFSASEYQSETAGFGLERSLTEKLSLRVAYDFLRQRGTGRSSLFGSFDRDLWSVQLSYRFHQIALAR
jgi:AMIN domain-containing protein